MKAEITCRQLMEATRGYSVGDIADFVKDIRRFSMLFPEYKKFALGLTGTYIFNYTNFRYEYIDEPFALIAERQKEYIYDNGLGPKENIWYEPDQEIFTGKILAKNLEFFKGVSVGTHDQFEISCNYRNRTGDGGLKNILQRSFVIRSTPEGIPTAVIGYVTDISKLWNDNRLVHSIRSVSGGVDALHYSGEFYSHEGNINLTKRQIEVIKCICDELPDKLIADKLHISIKTVEHHKREIRKLLNITTTIGIVKYAMANGYY